MADIHRNVREVVHSANATRGKNALLTVGTCLLVLMMVVSGGNRENWDLKHAQPGVSTDSEARSFR